MPQLPDTPKRTDDISLDTDRLASAEEFAQVMRQLYPSFRDEHDDYKLTHAILTAYPEFRTHVVDPLEGQELLAPPPPPISPVISGEPPPKPDTTALSKAEEARFQKWAKANNIPDVDHPQSFYDYRGVWKATRGQAITPGQHFPDTFKQHGHPTFSVESQY